MKDFYDVRIFVTDEQRYDAFAKSGFIATFYHRLETLPVSTLPAPTHTDAFSKPHKDLYTGKPVAPTHTASDKAPQLAPVDSATGAMFDKGYKIYVRTKARDGRFTLVGYVLCTCGKRVAYDVFGKEHVIKQSARLREKHVRKAFGIDARFDIKQTCIQFDKQRDSTRAKHSPHVPNTPVYRRPNVC